jgi:hypothetical protein
MEGVIQIHDKVGRGPGRKCGIAKAECFPDRLANFDPLAAEALDHQVSGKILKGNLANVMPVIRSSWTAELPQRVLEA